MSKIFFVTLMLFVGICGCSGSGSKPVSLSGVNVAPSSANISPGTTTQFRATGVFSDGGQADLSGSVAWSSSNPAVATVNAQGVATGVGAGTTVISALSGSVSGSGTLTVAAVQSIGVTPANPVSIVGTTQQFTATATLSNGAVQNLTGQVLWSTSNQAVATISATGLATAVGGGTASVTAQAGGVLGSANLNVVTLVSASLAPVNPTVDAGASLQFTATGTLSDGSSRNVSSLVSWSSANPAVATVNANGLASGLFPGATSISAAFPGMATGSAGLTVLGPTFIAATPGGASAVAGSTQQFTATGSFADGSSHDLTALATWSSSAPSVASISNAAGSRGVATAVRSGSTVIAATMGVAGSTLLTVKTLASLAITPASPAIGVGSSLRLTATGSFSDGSSQDLTASVSWLSSAPAIASISNVAGTRGIVSANALGSAIVTASFGGISATATIAVIPTNRAYVSNFGSNNLSVVDIASNTLLTNIAVGAGPRGVAVNGSLNRAYVANGNGSTLSVVDIAGNAVVATVNVGSGPWGVAVHPAAKRVYVANSQSGTLSVIDATNNTVVATVAVGSFPRGVAVNTATNRVYVANFGSNTLSVINGVNNTVTDTVSVGLAPVDVAVNPATGRVYVANSFSATLSVLDANDAPVTDVQVGSAAQGVAVNPVSGRVYVTLGNTGTLTVIDGASDASLTSIPVGTGPQGVAVRVATGRVYVANNSGNTVSVVDAASNVQITTIPGFAGPNYIALIP